MMCLGDENPIETAGTRIIPAKPMIGGYPHVAVLIACDVPNHVVRKAVGILSVVVPSVDTHAFVPGKTTFGADPYKAVAVLVQSEDLISW